jgi:hypothetical protein
VKFLLVVLLIAVLGATLATCVANNVKRSFDAHLTELESVQ